MSRTPTTPANTPVDARIEAATAQTLAQDDTIRAAGDMFEELSMMADSLQQVCWRAVGDGESSTAIAYLSQQIAYLAATFSHACGVGDPPGSFERCASPRCRDSLAVVRKARSHR